MATIQIPDELDIVLEDAAMRAGRSKDDFALQIIATHLEEESLPLSAFTEAQLERMKESVAQLDRGEHITSEEVDRRFEVFFNRLEAR
jgi:predicted transcriptional regulator